MTDEALLTALSSMQANLKAELSSMQTNLKAEISSVQTNLRGEMSSMQTNLRAEMSSMREDLLGHIHGVGAQLHSQIQEVVERLDRIEGRLDRQGGIVQGGSRAMTRIIEWSESADTTFIRYDRRLMALEKRLEQIEGGKNGK